MTAIKTILVPTDFSDPATNAAQYALKLAGAFQATIILYHTFTPYESGFYLQEEGKKENDATEAELAERLNKNRQQLLSDGSDVPVSVHVDRGPHERRLIEFCDKNSIDLIVMGTIGASGLKEAVIGSFTAGTMSKASCPVLAIPENYTYKAPQKVTYASDYNQADVQVMEFLSTWKKLFNFTLCVLHVNASDDPSAKEKDAFGKYKTVLESQCENIPNSFHHASGDDVPTAIMDYISKDNTDILAMMPVKREGIWDRMFHKSVTKSMANQIQIPLLTIPAP